MPGTRREAVEGEHSHRRPHVRDTEPPHVASPLTPELQGKAQRQEDSTSAQVFRTQKGHRGVWQSFLCCLKSLQLTSSSSSSSSSDSRTPSSKSSMKKNKLIRKPTRLVTWSLSVIWGTHVSITWRVMLLSTAQTDTPDCPDHRPSTPLATLRHTHGFSWTFHISHSSLLPFLATSSTLFLSECIYSYSCKHNIGGSCRAGE